jgi:cell division protein FtsI/penicillin-binding protein 2
MRINGTTLILTINRDLQAAAEEILDTKLFNLWRAGWHDCCDGSAQRRDACHGRLPPHGLESSSGITGTIYDNATEFNPAISKPMNPAR